MHLLCNTHPLFVTIQLIFITNTSYEFLRRMICLFEQISCSHDCEMFFSKFFYVLCQTIQNKHFWLFMLYKTNFFHSNISFYTNDFVSRFHILCLYSALLNKSVCHIIFCIPQKQLGKDIWIYLIHNLSVMNGFSATAIAAATYKW